MDRFFSKQEALLAGFLGVFGVIPLKRPVIYTRPTVSSIDTLHQDWQAVGKDMRNVIKAHNEAIQKEQL